MSGSSAEEALHAAWVQQVVLPKVRLPMSHVVSCRWLKLHHTTVTLPRFFIGKHKCFKQLRCSQLPSLPSRTATCRQDCKCLGMCPCFHTADWEEGRQSKRLFAHGSPAYCSQNLTLHQKRTSQCACAVELFLFSLAVLLPQLANFKQLPQTAT